MRKSIAACRMVGICAFIALYLIIVGIPILLYCRMRSDVRLALRYARLLNRMVLFLAGVKVEVQGFEHLNQSTGCVYVGNHKSYVDTLVIYFAVPADVRFLAKKEIYRIPLVSFALRTMGIIEVDRSDREAAAQSIDRAVSEIQKGRSIILFPEGTRSRYPHMLPFKKGAFVLSIRAQAPVVPFTLLGTERIIKADTIFLYPGTVKVIFHRPIDTQGLTLDDRNNLLKQTRDTIEKTFMEWQAEQLLRK